MATFKDSVLQLWWVWAVIEAGPDGWRVTSSDWGLTVLNYIWDVFCMNWVGVAYAAIIGRE